MFGRGRLGRSSLGDRHVRVERPILVQDRLLHVAQRSARFDAELLDQRLAGCVEGGERVRLPTRSVERQHQLAAQALTEGMRGDESLDLGGELAVPPEREVGIDAGLRRGEPKFLQCGDRSLGERVVREVGESGPAPQAQRAGQHGGSRFAAYEARLVEVSLEAIRVDNVGIDRQPVAGPDGLDDPGWLALAVAGLEQLPELRDEALHDRARGRRGVLAPQLIDQPIGGDDLSRVQDEECQQRPAAPGRKVDPPVAVEDLHRPQDSELHPSPPPAGLRP